MLTLSTRYQIIIGLVLALFMVITRGHHFASLQNVPSASWAVFFLAGVYLRSAWSMPGFLLLPGRWITEHIYGLARVDFV